MSKKGRSGKPKKNARRSAKPDGLSATPARVGADGLTAAEHPSHEPKVIVAQSVPPAELAEPVRVVPAVAPGLSTPAAFAARDSGDSIPPVDLEEGFFSERPPHPAPPPDDLDEVRPAKMTAAARARRALFQKYVKGTVAVLVALCIVAVLRAATGHGHDDTSPVAAAERHEVIVAAPQAPPAPTQLDLARVPAPLSVAAAAEKMAADESAVEVATPKAKEAPGGEAPKAEAAKPVETPKAESPKVEAADAPKPTKTAGQEKAIARQALEAGRAGVAIEAGERSVALDPTDGEAWLLLGAAYQERGKTSEARRCFNSCLKQGKKGPIGECRAMLQ